MKHRPSKLLTALLTSRSWGLNYGINRYEAFDAMKRHCETPQIGMTNWIFSDHRADEMKSIVKWLTKF